MRFFYYLFSLLGSFFLFASFILNLFIVIGQLSNRPFINRLYFAQASQQGSDQYVNLGLWNHCLGSAQGVQSCSHPQAAYNWIQAPGINQVLSSVSLSSGLFLGAFILFFIGLCLSFLLWLISMPLCCVPRRAVGASMSTFVGITFLVMLTALIMELVFVIRGNHLLHNADPTWSGHAGNSLWLTIGSVISLLLGFFSYGGSCCCVGGRDTSAVAAGAAAGAAAGGSSKRFGRSKVNPDYGEKHVGDDGGAGEDTEAGRTGGGRSPYNLNQSVYHAVSQQASPRMGQQRPQDHGYGQSAAGGNFSPMPASQGFEHQPSPQMGNRQPGYQTPILQHTDADGRAV